MGKDGWSRVHSLLIALCVQELVQDRVNNPRTRHANKNLTSIHINDIHSMGLGRSDKHRQHKDAHNHIKDNQRNAQKGKFSIMKKIQSILLSESAYFFHHLCQSFDGVFLGVLECVESDGSSRRRKGELLQ